MSLFTTDSKNAVLSWSQAAINMGWNTWEDGANWQAGNIAAPTAIFRVEKPLTPASTDGAFKWYSAMAGTPELSVRMYMSYAGNLGIGTSTPSNKLDVEGGAAIGSAYSGANAAPADGLIVQGNVGIGTATPGKALTVAGDMEIGTGAGDYRAG